MKIFIMCALAGVLVLPGCGAEHGSNTSKNTVSQTSQGQAAPQSPSETANKKDDKDPRQQIQDQFKQ